MNSTGRPRPRLLLIALAYVGFVSLGMPDAVLGVAWPSVRDRFDLPQGAIGLAFAAAGTGYFLTSFFAGTLTRILGIGLLLAGSTAVVAAAQLGFAFAPFWILFVACELFHGFGSGAIDAGLNSYAAHHMSARHMNWLHACYCFGAMLGPLLMTGILTTGHPYGTGYASVGIAMLALATVFLATRPMWGEADQDDTATTAPLRMRDAMRHAGVLLHMLVFFVYCGVETALSQWTFTVLTESRGVSAGAAGVAVGVYWGSIGAGRIGFGFVAERIGLDRLLRLCLLAAVGGAVLFALPLPPVASFAGLVLVGIGFAPVYPCLMTRTPQRLGTALSAHAIGFQVGAAMIGAAAIPGLLGLLAQAAGLEALTLGTAALAVVLWLVHELLVRMDRR
ncbi:MAG: MFS transporter [Gemmataceae bacterium]